MTVTPASIEVLADSAYLVDLGNGQGRVIHPERNTTPYLVTAERHDRFSVL